MDSCVFSKSNDFSGGKVSPLYDNNDDDDDDDDDDDSFSFLLSANNCIKISIPENETIAK